MNEAVKDDRSTASERMLAACQRDMRLALARIDVLETAIRPFMRKLDLFVDIPDEDAHKHVLELRISLADLRCVGIAMGKPQ